MKIKKDDIIDYIKTGGKAVGNLALKIYGDSLNKIGEEAFSEAIEIGIANTIASLYDANVDDKTILRIVNEHWGLTIPEIVERLVVEKQQATLRSVKQYLKLNGYSESETTKFLRDNLISSKIRHQPETWEMRDNPQEIIKLLEKKL
ncbi:MAG: hypothetical protein ACI4HZ_03005 [Ruminococcus sp.]